MSAQKREQCQAILSTFANATERQPGARCGSDALTGGSLCWTHTHASANPNRARELEMIFGGEA